MITKQVSLNTWSTNNVVVYANSGEVYCRYIEVSFKDENQNNINLTNKSVTFYAKKSDNTTIFNYCTVDTINNTATTELTSQALSIPGILECEFQIFDKNNVLLKVNGLKIFVSNSKDFSQAIESSSESNVLTSLINDVKENSEKIGNLVDLTTTEKSTIVDAINEINQTTTGSCSSSIGQLSNLSTTEKSTVVGAINELDGKIISAHILYSNYSGTNSTITLSDNISNYNYIEIYYFKDLNQIISTKIYNPNGKAATLNSVTYYSNTLFLRAAIVDINETTITWRYSDSGWGTVTDNSSSLSNEQVFLISKVIGYK